MKPIIFNTEMARAILDNRKTVTRRVVKPQPKAKLAYCCMGHGHGKWSYPGKDAYKCWEDESFKLPEDILPDELEKLWTPPCHTGDILYVRETWARSMAGTYLYRATDTPLILDGWCPSIHMPRETARIFLRVTGVRVERLQDIGGPEIITKEGVSSHPYDHQTPEWYEAHPELLTDAVRAAFAGLWESTIKPADRALYGWDADPYVWVIEFERCEKPEGD